MPAWDQFKKRYAMEPGDLGNQSGFTIAVIEKVDSEEYLDRKNIAQVRHQLYFAGYEYPLRLNNTRIDVLKALFGLDTETAAGKKVALLCAASQSYGETEITINIHPMPIPQDAPVTPVRHDVACRNSIRRRHAEMLGVPFAPSPAALPAGGGAGGQPWTHPQAVGALPPGVAGGAGGGTGGQAGPAGKPLGMASAAKLVMLLRERGREWDFVLSHLRTCAMSHLAEGKSPPDCDEAIKGPIWSVLKDLPVTKPADDRAKAEAEADLVAAWTPPAPTPTTVNGQDGKPLEVVDDIPF